jgi:hypothetical protein
VNIARTLGKRSASRIQIIPRFRNATAVETGVDIRATGDLTHLLPLGEHCEVRILTPQALLAELLNPD